MSFPAESRSVSLESINTSDVLIEDRMIGAMKSTAGNGGVVKSLESKAAGRTQFYSKLIDTLAENIHSKESENKKDWTLEKLKTASMKILDIVTANDKIRRFIWKRQFPTQHYIHLSRIETVNKIANDLLCRIRKLEATADNKSKPPPGEPCPKRLNYAHCLILMVCNAHQAGEPPNRAVFRLDRPPYLHQLSSAASSTPDESKRYDETPQERGLRLSLRQRFLACIRTNNPIVSFANALLAQWGLPQVGATLKSNPALPSVTKPYGSKGSEASFGIDTESSKLQPIRARSKTSKETGTWCEQERIVFLRAFETYPIGQWSKMASLIPGRTSSQVARFGRYIKKKFDLEQGAFPDTAVREYLLRPD